MLRHPLPPPRNIVELPLYVFLKWRVWPPMSLLLGVPDRDVEDRFSSGGPRVVAFNPRLYPRVRRGLAARADFVINSGRRGRRGPHRGSGSVQNIIDIGMCLPAPALAWMLIWRDYGIVHGVLGYEQLVRGGGWWRALSSWTNKVRKHRERFRKLGASDQPLPQMPRDIAELRRGAVIAARGAAARSGGAAAQSLLSDAFERYRHRDPLLEAVQLPDVDLYGYHPDVRHLIPFFVAPGGTVADYRGEVTHLVVDEPAVVDGDDETAREVIL